MLHLWSKRRFRNCLRKPYRIWIWCPAVCSNAVWAIGKVCARCRENPALLEPFAPSLLQNLIALLMGNDLNGYHSLLKKS
jgi:hypothetical protein